MSEKKGKAKGKDGFWDALASNQAAIYILIVLGVVCLAGVIVPQRFITLDEAQYAQMASRGGWATFAARLGLFDVFHTLWFRGLVLLLVINLVLCTVKNVRRNLRLLRGFREKRGEGLIQGMRAGRTVKSDQAPDVLERRARRLLEAFGKVEDRSEGDLRVLYAERGRINRFAAPVIHLAVLIIVAGAMIGNLFGLKGDMLIPVGQTADAMRLERARPGMETIDLGFSVRCEDFDIEFYPGTERPKDYRSMLVILRDGREVTRKIIEVNDPLDYAGFRFFQASYGVLGNVFSIDVRDGRTSKTWNLSADFQQEVSIPETGDRFVVTEVKENHMNAGPAVRIAIRRTGEPEKSAWLFLNAPDFDAMRGGRYHFVFSDAGQRYYTGLSVSKDQGVPVIWAGCIVLFVGLGMAYLLSHRRACAVIRQGEVEIRASANRNIEGLEDRMERLLENFNDPID